VSASTPRSVSSNQNNIIGGGLFKVHQYVLEDILETICPQWSSCVWCC